MIVLADDLSLGKGAGDQRRRSQQQLAGTLESLMEHPLRDLPLALESKRGYLRCRLPAGAWELCEWVGKRAAVVPRRRKVNRMSTLLIVVLVIVVLALLVAAALLARRARERREMERE